MEPKILARQLVARTSQPLEKTASMSIHEELVALNPASAAELEKLAGVTDSIVGMWNKATTAYKNGANRLKNSTKANGGGGVMNQIGSEFNRAGRHVKGAIETGYKNTKNVLSNPMDNKAKIAGGVLGVGALGSGVAYGMSDRNPQSDASLNSPQY